MQSHPSIRQWSCRIRPRVWQVKKWPQPLQKTFGGGESFVIWVGRSVPYCGRPCLAPAIAVTSSPRSTAMEAQKSRKLEGLLPQGHGP